MKNKQFFIKYWYWILIGLIILFFILRQMEIFPLSITEIAEGFDSEGASIGIGGGG